jgi:2,5-furandicarboxylate decarboxylase 1
VPVCRCSTVNLEVPAAAEIVLEGRVALNEHGAGGPETLPSRLYSAAYKGPVAEIHRVTAYSDAIAHGLLNASRDHLNVMHWLKEFQIARHLRHIGFESKVRAVKVNPSGCDWMYAAVALEREHAAEARALIESLLNAKLALGGLRRVVIVDTDVDIGDPRAVDWAIATRMRPESDLVIVEPSKIRGPDPAARGGPLAKLGMDATIPAGQEVAYALPTVDWAGPLDLPAKLPPMAPAVAQLLSP